MFHSSSSTFSSPVVSYHVMFIEHCFCVKYSGKYIAYIISTKTSAATNVTHLGAKSIELGVIRQFSHKELEIDEPNV